MTARDGVKWNDGEDFTAEDIAFTFELLRDNPAHRARRRSASTTSTVDGDKVTITFENSVFVKQDKVLEKFIVPEHIWADVADPTTETNPEPVGTGPYTLTSFSSQSVQLDQRDDYWGGELAVPTLYFVSYNDNTALTTALANGDADWAQGFIPNVEDAYLSKDEDNQYWAPAGLGVDGCGSTPRASRSTTSPSARPMNLVVDRDAAPGGRP